MAAFGGAAWPAPGIREPALRGLPAISESGAPHRGQRRAPNREGQSAAMKWVRINEIWYYEAGTRNSCGRSFENPIGLRRQLPSPKASGIFRAIFAPAEPGGFESGADRAGLSK